MAERSHDETGFHPYMCEEVDSAKNNQEGEFVPPTEPYFEYKSRTDTENFVDLDQDLKEPHELDIKPLKLKTLKEMILRESVPTVLCLASTTGLPDSLQSAAVQTVLTSKSIEEKEDFGRKCLAACDVSILSRHPTTGYIWKSSSKRCGVAHFFLSHLARCDVLHDQRYSVEPVNEHTELFESPMLNQHFNWVYKDVSENYKRLLSEHAGRQFYRSGASLIRIWDADGSNKAIHEFQRVASGHFTRSLRLAFFRLDRDADKFNEPLLIQHRQLCHEQTRLKHLLNTIHPAGSESHEQNKGTAVMFATTCEDNVDMTKLEEARKTIMKAAKEQHIDHVIYDEFLHGSVCIDKEALKQQQRILEEAVYYNWWYTVHLPLKWIFLRSALAGEKKPKLFVEVDKLRILAKQLKFSDEEFEKFLVTFTSFGSILYCPEYPPLKTHILTDIPKFCEILDRLCYPKPEDSSADISKYGIITKREVSYTLEEGLTDHFMKVLLSLGMAAKVPHSRLKGCPQSEDSFFLPSARRSVKADTQFLPESVYIVITSNHNPLDIQATFVRSILKEIKETSLEASTLFNTSCFSIANSDTRLMLVFHHNSVEIRLKFKIANVDELERLQAEVLLKCSFAMNRHSDHNKGLQSYIGLTCTATADYQEKPTFHAIEKEEVCRDCQQTQIRQSWIKTAKKHFDQQVSYRSEPQLTEMFKNAENLSKKFRRDDDKSEELADRLKLTPEQLQMTAGLTGSDKIMMMLLIWKQTRKLAQPELQKLIEIFLNHKESNE